MQAQWCEPFITLFVLNVDVSDIVVATSSYADRRFGDRSLRASSNRDVQPRSCAGKPANNERVLGCGSRRATPIAKSGEAKLWAQILSPSPSQIQTTTSSKTPPKTRVNSP